MDDDGSNAAEFWAERIAILWIDGGMKGMDAEHLATICTKKWCRRTGHAEPKDTRWQLLSKNVTGDEPIEPSRDPLIKADRGWW
jgi:hypothetical protein